VLESAVYVWNHAEIRCIFAIGVELLWAKSMPKYVDYCLFSYFSIIDLFLLDHLKNISEYIYCIIDRKLHFLIPLAIRRFESCNQENPALLYYYNGWAR